MDWDEGRTTYTTSNFYGNDEEGLGSSGPLPLGEATRQMREFIRTYRGIAGRTQGFILPGGGVNADVMGDGMSVIPSSANFPYRDQLISRWRKKEPWLEVELCHVNEFSSRLMDGLQIWPVKYLRCFENAAQEVLIQLIGDGADSRPTEMQVILQSDQSPTDLRSITAEHMNRLIKIPGILIGCHAVQSKAHTVNAQCRRCQAVRKFNCEGQYSETRIELPNECPSGGSECGSQPFVVLLDECTFSDQQSLKLQESPEMVPTGGMPRHVRVVVDRALVDRVSPGNRVCVVGVPSLQIRQKGTRSNKSEHGARAIYIRGVGIQLETDGPGRSGFTFTPSEEEMFLRISRMPNVYEALAKAVAPSISGDYTKDIKKAIICQLFGGSRKVLPDATRLRGGINLLLMGDPSTAKSQNGEPLTSGIESCYVQIGSGSSIIYTYLDTFFYHFLKFVEKVAPIGVYTSGKGSSAAGLTASVIKNSRGDFYLEGGAMVLADGGIVCIDEFDKMRESDRVAIHEAMEQQTISIAKAGITTVLNSRTSVLAAANPIYGRYDDMKSVAENIDLMTTIISRFDLIFVVKDIRNEERDISIARHVMGVHTSASASIAGPTIEITRREGGGGLGTSGDPLADLDITIMKKYISYCRNKCAPLLSQEAAEVLGNEYVSIREQIRKQEVESSEDCAIPVTVRQLEALVRLSESLAKMRLSSEAKEVLTTVPVCKVSVADVSEALRLFRVSTLAATKSTTVGDLGGMSAEGRAAVLRAEEFLKQRIPIRTLANRKRLEEEAASLNHDATALGRAVAIMAARGELQEKKKGFFLHRLR